MFENIPKANRDEYTIINTNIKYPTYPDKDFQDSISDDSTLNNYSEENNKKAFEEFLLVFLNCKNITLEIIEKNIHNFQEYNNRELNLKTINFIFNFYILEKYINLIQKKFFKIELDDDLKKELSLNEMILDCENEIKNFNEIYKVEFKTENEIKINNEKYIPSIERYNKLLKYQDEIGFIIIRVIKYLNKYFFSKLEEDLKTFKNIATFKSDKLFKTKANDENEAILLDIILRVKKIYDLDLFFYNASILDKNDISNLNEESEEWQNLEKILVRIIPKNAEEIRNKILDKGKNLDLGYSLMSNAQVDASLGSLFFSGIKYAIYYKAAENKSKIDSKKYQITNTIENILELIGLFPKVKFFFKKILPIISFRKKIYVKKEFPTITRSYIEKIINFMKGENNNINNVNLNNNKTLNDSLPIMYYDKVPDKTIKRNYVSVTVLHSKKLYFKEENTENNKSLFKGVFKKNEKLKYNYNDIRKNTILIAIHGGGFISSSTLIHEKYYRKWAKKLNIPIFGINYSLAPKYQYPESLNDVYQAYMWILKHANDVLYINIKHIIIAGDSAGANLALGLYNLLIAIKEYDPEIGKNIILPELIWAQYPVTYVNLKSFSNSFLLSLDSPMLNIETMKFMYETYVKNYEIEDEDPFLNPIKVNNFILDRIKSKIRIFFGTEDVLREDGVRLLNIFNKYNNKKEHKNFIDIRGYDLLYLIHGFNTLDKKLEKIGRSIILPEIEEFLGEIE